MKVSLSFFQDDATGEYGLAHTNSLDKGFNAFWTAQGIFHDVFEHYFEENHKYFMGDAAFNIGGEVAAMGHLAYYVHSMGIGYERSLNRRGYIDDMNIVASTQSDIYETIIDGYVRFGVEFICNVPRQKSGDYNIETIISEHWYQIQEAKKKPYGGDEYDKEYANTFKKSLTLGKLNNLYRWGYSTAAKMIPDTKQNRNKLISFLDTFDEIIKISAEEMANVFKGIEFEITEGENFNWKAEFITQDNKKVDAIDMANRGMECIYELEEMEY